jgi:hypothetical protein
VTFPVLFVYICVLNNCHRVVTQFLLNIYIISYHITKLPIMQFSPTIFCCFLIISEYSPRNSACTHFQSDLTFREPWIVIYSYNKSQRDALFLNFILIKNSARFGQIYCPSSEVSTLYTQQ